MDIKDRIIEGSSELFRMYGIKSVTMDSIAGHFGISKRTIYELFSDKEELLMAVLARMAQQQKVLAKKVLDESENSLVAIFRMFEINRTIFQSMSPAFQSDLKKYHYDILIMNSNSIELPDYRNNFQIIEKGVKEGLFRKDINPELANRCLFNLGRSIMDNELFPYELFSRRDVIRNIFFNYLRGISTEKGLKLINRLEEKFLEKTD
jgi:TetR/AcrR family transcriptional regulator, cholesterol catabolism regulator